MKQIGDLSDEEIENLIKILDFVLTCRRFKTAISDYSDKLMMLADKHLEAAGKQYDINTLNNAFL